MDQPPLRRLILVDVRESLCAEWRDAFRSYPEVSVVYGRFEDLPEYECVVAAGNSFGIMDGGVDEAIRDRFPGVERRVQAAIREDFHGYQPVGTSVLVPTEDPDHAWVAYTPTMRVPMPLSGGLINNVHSAMWAMLCVIRSHNRSSSQPINIVACPGLGTSAGGVRPAKAARLMALAYGYHREAPPVATWHVARGREEQLG